MAGATEVVSRKSQLGIYSALGILAEVVQEGAGVEEGEPGLQLSHNQYLADNVMMYVLNDK